MGLREGIAKIIAPGLKNEAELRASMANEIKAMVAEQITKAKMDMPISVNYDPKNEGYRRVSDSIYTRNLLPVQQQRMFEICYFMFDSSAMFKRLAQMDKGFLFSGPVKVSSEDEDVQNVIDRFWNDSENCMAIKFPERAMWLSVLGEQCWPVEVNPYNGFVRMGYEDPALIKDIWVNPLKIDQLMQVEMMGLEGRAGKKYAIIRKDYNINSKTYDRLVGDCFFFAINKPPNSARGRSDFMTLVDWIDSLERYGYNYLERAELMLNFVWDITLKGANADQIQDFLRDNPPPEPGSQRAHNENVTWDAVSPELKAQDFKSGFEMGKSFVMGAAGRPESWFGSGGKMYQTEADAALQAPVTDLEQRQEYLKYQIRSVIQFAIDQAVSHSTLTPAQAETGFSITMPEVSKKDLAKMGNVIPQLTTALTLAVNNKFIRRDTAIQLFAFMAGYLGYEVDAQAEIDAAAAELPPDQTDYEALLKAAKEKGQANAATNIV
jgi:predicted XRE-type DNA-binding protein